MLVRRSRRATQSATVILISLCSTAPASATFDLWQFQELFSNGDGTIQFIELFTAFNDQEFANGEIFRSTQGANTLDYTFLSNTPTPTANHHLLLATAGFAAIPGAPTPDFIIPDGFLFVPDGKVDNLSLGGPAITYANLPTDGVLSLGGDGVTTGTNSPTNYAGQTASIDVSVVAVPLAEPDGVDKNRFISFVLRQRAHVIRTIL